MEIAVPVTVVRSRSEAEMACAMLRAHGIHCSYRETDIGAQAFAWWQEILVRRADVDAARQLLAAASGAPSSST